MGKLVNAKFLRLGHTIDWLSMYPTVGWEGSKVLKDYWYMNYIRGIMRWSMRKDAYSLSDIGIWYSHSCIKRLGSRVELCVFFRECDIDGFLYKGYTSMFDSIEGRSFKKRRLNFNISIRLRKRFSKIRYLMYESLRRRIMLDLKKKIGLNIVVGFYKIRRSKLNSTVIGEYIYRRISNGESIKDVLWDFKRELRKLDDEARGNEIFSIKRGKRYIWLRKKAKLQSYLRGLKDGPVRYKLNALVSSKHARLVSTFVKLIRYRTKFRYKFRNRIGSGILRIKRHGWKIKGLQIEGRGMFVRRHKSMSQVFKLLKGRVLRSSLDEEIDYNELSINLRTSKCGLKIWLNRGHRQKLGKKYLVKGASQKFKIC